MSIVSPGEVGSILQLVVGTDSAEFSQVLTGDALLLCQYPATPVVPCGVYVEWSVPQYHVTKPGSLKVAQEN